MPYTKTHPENQRGEAQAGSYSRCPSFEASISEARQLAITAEIAERMGFTVVPQEPLHPEAAKAAPAEVGCPGTTPQLQHDREVAQGPGEDPPARLPGTSMGTVGREGYAALVEAARIGLLQVTVEPGRVAAPPDLGTWSRPTTLRGRFPYGFALDPRRPGRPARHADRLATVLELFYRVRDGESLRAIADALNAWGVPTPGDCVDADMCRAVVRRRWTSRAIRRILTNPIYKGMVVSGRRPVARCTHRPVRLEVDPDHWRLVRDEHFRAVPTELWDEVNVSCRRRSGSGRVPAADQPAGCRTAGLAWEAH